MIRKSLKLHICLMLLLAAVGTISSATAAEFSVYDWWTNQPGMVDMDNNPVSPWWGNTYAGWSTSTLWSWMDAGQYTWTVPPLNVAPSDAQAYLEVEWAGHLDGNCFGWYDVTAPNVLHNIWPGPADGPDGPVRINLNPNQTIGFYLAWPDDDPLGNIQNIFFSDPTRNGPDGNPLTLDGSDVAPGYQHVRAFHDPNWGLADDTNLGWVLCWEDLPFPSNGGANYASAWANDASLDWAAGPEPDYNDMIVSVEFGIERLGRTPELSTWLLMSLSLAAIPVLRRRRRA